MTALDRASTLASTTFGSATPRRRTRAARRALAALLIAASVGAPAFAGEASARDERSTVLPSGHGKPLFSSTYEMTMPNFAWEGYRPFAISFWKDFVSSADTSHYYYEAALPLIENTGPDATGWYWWFDQTPESLAQHVKDVHGRIISLYPYFSHATTGTLYAAVVVPNTGAQAKAWWWYPAIDKGSIDGVLKANGARLIDLHQREEDHLYSIVMIANTGADYEDSHWGAGVPMSEVVAQVQAHNGRLTRLAPEADAYTVYSSPVGSWDYILEPAGGKKWWWYFNKEASEIVDLQKSLHARVVDMEAHVEMSGQAGHTFYSVVLLGNSD
jgi:hypothetical protein